MVVGGVKVYLVARCDGTCKLTALKSRDAFAAGGVRKRGAALQEGGGLACGWMARMEPAVVVGVTRDDETRRASAGWCSWEDAGEDGRGNGCGMGERGGDWQDTHSGAVR